ncbi:MAG: amine oxidase [Legionella sp.]|nr:MAG: amine oxidase [Legionella sp.]
MYPTSILRRFFSLTCLFLSSLFSMQGAFANSKPVEVIIIGAGVSGIIAANQLNQQGIHAIILEARDRIGGRVYTIQPWGTATDLGASWIHKINNNPLSALAIKYNIPILPTEYSHESPVSMLESATIFDANGKKFSQKRFGIALEQIKKFITYLDDHASSFSNNYSITDALQDYMKINPMNQDSLDLLVHINGDSGEYENGANIANTSYKVANDTQSVTSGADVIFTHGYSQLLSKLTQDIPIFLNQVVTKIVYDKEGVTVYTKDNKQYKAKYLLSTLPLGVLKANTIEFSPTLPKDKLAAIQRIGMGVYNKAFLLFDKPFWDLKAEWLVFLSKKEDSHEDFEVMNYYPRSKQPILLVFTTGDFASELEKHSDKDIVDLIMKRLKTTYGNKIPNPTSYQITHWGTDPYAKGSFSYPRIGSSVEDYKILAAPVDNRIFFAGEATSSTDPSTVTGAYLSGIRAANEIAKLYKKK